ncbi:MAG: zinc ribbon domain-containing protein, partial [Chloroflexi bacterium]|nr:zinc ribbon domain-containing protein [Chloroflexota bacterium]
LAASLESRGSIGKWDEKLVDVEQANKYSRVTGYEKLQQEMARFETWGEQQRPHHIEPGQVEQPICPQCGHEVRVGASFCGTCGVGLG